MDRRRSVVVAAGGGIPPTTGTRSVRAAGDAAGDRHRVLAGAPLVDLANWVAMVDRERSAGSGCAGDYLRRAGRSTDAGGTPALLCVPLRRSDCLARSAGA